MLRLLCTILLAAGLAGCATSESIGKSIQEKYVGRPIGSAIDRLGFPTRDQTMAGRHVYTWDISRTSPNLTTLASGQVVIQGSSTYGCSLGLEVDSNDVVIRYSFTGQMGACEAFN
jgi:hypothetical protein